MEIWYKVFCMCGATNWVSGGDPKDMSDVDVEVYRCWECSTCNMMDYDFDDSLTEDQMENVAVDGLKKPK